MELEQPRAVVAHLRQRRGGVCRDGKRPLQLRQSPLQAIVGRIADLGLCPAMIELVVMRDFTAQRGNLIARFRRRRVGSAHDDCEHDKKQDDQ
jgi:hypothetical protein